MTQLLTENFRLAENFWLHEFEKSATAERLGIDNRIPNETYRAAIRVVAEQLQYVRDAIGGQRIDINSGYRCRELNAAIRGTANSQHARCEAADFECPGMHNIILARELTRTAGVCWDQLIIEDVSLEDPSAGWLHCSFLKDKIACRKQVLRMFRVGGRGKYEDIGKEGLELLVKELEKKENENATK